MCFFCEQTFDDRNEAIDHFMNHLSEKLICNLCPKSGQFADLEELQNHNKTHFKFIQKRAKQWVEKFLSSNNSELLLEFKNELNNDLVEDKKKAFEEKLKTTLNYCPKEWFQCKLCRQMKAEKVYCSKKIDINHIQVSHQKDLESDVSEEDFEEFYDKRNSFIPVLDDFINEMLDN